MLGKPTGAKSFKARIRMEKVARLEAAGLADAEIAAHVGITTAALAGIKTRPEYKVLVRQVATGVISQYDEQLAANSDFQRARLQSMVPPALDALFKAVTNPIDQRLAVEAAKQILDRDGRLAQVSRIGLAAPNQGGFAATQKDVEAANSIVELFKTLKESEGTAGQGGETTETSETTETTETLEASSTSRAPNIGTETNGLIN